MTISMVSGFRIPVLNLLKHYEVINEKENRVNYYISIK